MPLSDFQRLQASEWLESKTKKMPCPVCGSRKLNFGEVISGTAVDGGPMIPMLQVICERCFNIRLFAARPIGLLDE